MASGNKPQDHQLKNSQLDNKQTRKHNEIPPLKRTKKGLRKYGVKMSSPIQENTKEYNAKNGECLKKIEQDLKWIGLCFQFYAIRPQTNHQEIKDKLWEVTRYIKEDLPKQGLDPKFVDDVGHCVNNKASALWLMFNRSGMGLTDLKRNTYERLLKDFEELEKINGR